MFVVSVCGGKGVCCECVGGRVFVVSVCGEGCLL